MPSLTRCLCKLDDCAYFNAVQMGPGECDCAHTDKHHYMTNPCPLYRKNWQAKSGNSVEDLKARFLKKRV
ncbi:hypothetical protein BH09SUM1_BH09SUM1_12400 [soil metagenome]